MILFAMSRERLTPVVMLSHRSLEPSFPAARIKRCRMISERYDATMYQSYKADISKQVKQRLIDQAEGIYVKCLRIYST